MPEKLDKDFEYDFSSSFREHFIEMEDGAMINALHFERDNSKGLILYFHGNAGSLRRWGEVVEPFVELGFEVLIVDYRGYGKSRGKRTYQKMLSDADKLYAFALELTDEKNLILYGRSLGSSFASHLAGKNNPSKLILETPFFSLGDIAKRVVPFFPQNYLLRFNFKNYESLKDAECSIYIFHGTDDNVVPIESGEKLYKTLNSDQASFIVVQGGEHNNLAEFQEYQREIRKVLLDE